MPITGNNAADSMPYPGNNPSTKRRRRGRPTLGEHEARTNIRDMRKLKEIEAARKDAWKDVPMQQSSAAVYALSMTPPKSYTASKPALTELFGTEIAVVTKTNDTEDIIHLRQELVQVRAMLQAHEIQLELIKKALAEVAGIQK